MESAQPISEQAAAGQFLTFLMNGEEYGVDILRVQGIHGWDSATAIPNTPDFILGVINLRGSVVPIVDLRRRFGLDQAEFGPTTVVIIVRIDSGRGQQIVGLVVDAVSEVYAIDESEVQPPPDFGANATTDFVRGLATIDDKMVILMNVDNLLDEQDVAQLEATAAA